MQQLLLTSPNQLAWQSTQTPALLPSGALVRPIAVSTCDFDHLLCSGQSGLPLPLPIGHECVAEVLSVGAQVSNIKPGDRVIVSFQISCGQCRQCSIGRSSSCEAVPWLSCYGLGALSGDWGGAMSDVLAVPYADAMLFPLPEDLSASSATCLACNMPDAYRCAAPQLAHNPRAPVLIVAGAFDNIALYSTAIATALESRQVDVFGIDSASYDKVEALGGRILESASEVPSDHYPITVDASMNPESLALAVAASAAAGQLTISTMYANPDTVFPLMPAFEKCLNVSTGQPDVRSLLESSLNLMSAHKEKFALITDQIHQWQDAPRVFSSGKGKHVLMRD